MLQEEYKKLMLKCLPYWVIGGIIIIFLYSILPNTVWMSDLFIWIIGAFDLGILWYFVNKGV